MLLSKCQHKKRTRYNDESYCTHCLQPSEYSSTLIIGVIGLIFAALFLIFSPLQNHKDSRKINLAEDTINDITLSDTSITRELINLGCVLPNVALAQIKIESARYKSELTFTHKNICGIMKGDKYKSYDTYRECLADYVRIQNMYLAQIDRRYAADTNYIKLINKIK